MNKEQSYTFFAAVSRMKYIERWALMRASRPENLSEHSLEVAMIAHALCTIANVRYGKNLNGERAALIALYHDATEIITGDMPTPVKYGSDRLRSAYKAVEAEAQDHLLGRLPEDLQPAFREILMPEADETKDKDQSYMLRLVKAADKLSALIKCIEEENAGNGEFRTAKESTQRSIDAMCDELPEVRDFVREFLPPYGSTLDELS